MSGEAKDSYVASFWCGELPAKFVEGFGAVSWIDFVSLMVGRQMLALGLV